MKKISKTQLKEESLENIGAVLDQLKTMIRENSDYYDFMLTLIGRYQDLQSAEKSLPASSDERANRLGIQPSNQQAFLQHQTIQKNRIRAGLFELIKNLQPGDLNEDIMLT